MTATETRQTTRMTGGFILAEMLKAHNVGPMFGMGGFQLLPFYEAIRVLGLRHLLVNDERTGAFAADTYARVTGRIGVCDATLGPGATNLVTALAESLNAGVPLIAIVGDTHRRYSWKNMTQEARQTEILRPVCKELIRVETIERIPELVRRACVVATSGRPGPVVLDVPEDVCHGEIDLAVEDLSGDPDSFSAPAIRCRPDANAVVRAAALIEHADRPLILAGGGVHLSQADKELTAFAEDLSIPVAHTMSGKGAIACTHPLSAGLFGRYSRIANDLIELADCLIVVGCKLGEIATRRFTLVPPAIPLIHLDIHPEEFGRTTAATVRLWGDASLGLADLRAALGPSAAGQRSRREPLAAEVIQRMDAWREHARGRTHSDEKPINVARIVEELNRMLPADALLVADGGFAAHWTGLFYDTKKSGRTFLPDRGFASIGYGLPGALGARLAAPDRPVVAVTGDGGLNMTLGDLETARRAGAGIVICVVNNAASGYVKALQHAVYGAGNYQSSDLAETNYAEVARAMGCRGIRVEDPAELAAALAAGLAERSLPTVIDIVATRDPAAMLPAADARTLVVKPGDRPA
jgi:acetolactate synthase-1/2/3 large subunit